MAGEDLQAYRAAHPSLDMRGEVGVERASTRRAARSARRPPCVASSPKPVESVFVAVPDAAVYVAPRVSRASTSHDQATADEQRVDADLGLERRLGEADDAERAAPRLRLGGVVEQDEAAGAELGVGAVARRRDIGGEGDRPRREVAGRRQSR